MTAPALRLKCLGGGAVSDGMARDFRRIQELPKPARDRLWQALSAVLTEPVPPTADLAINEFCSAYGVTRAQLAPPLQAARFLLRACAAMNLSGQDFAADAATLTDGDTEIPAILLAGYEVAKDLLRKELKVATLRDHGRLFTGVDWRVDLLTSSSRGASIREPVATLTLKYLEGNEEKRLTLQLQPEGVLELKRVCEQLLE